MIAVVGVGRLTETVAEPDLLESCVETAVMVAVPVVEGVKTPVVLTEPMLDGLTDHETAGLKLPVPTTVGVHAEVCVVAIDVGEQVTETDVIVEGTVTVTVAAPDLVESCVEVAVTVTVPAPLGVNTPELPIVPILGGLTDHVTALLKLPVPCTVAAQVDVWVVKMDEGEQSAVTDVIVTGTEVTVTLAEPDLVESWVEVAVTVSEPEAGTLAGAVYSPELEIVPETADHVTVEL